MTTTWSAMLAERPSAAPAVLSAPARWTSTDLLHRAAGASHWLDEIQALPGVPIPALVTTVPASFALVVAGAGSHRPLAPLGPRLTVREIAACVEGMNAPLLLAEASFADVAMAVASHTGCRLALVPDGLPASSTADLDLDPRPEDIAFLLHTSGTSGIPKAVPIRQDRLARRVRANTALVELGPGRVYASASTFHHIAGMGMFAVALGAGAAVHCLPGFTVAGWQALGDAGVTHALLAPTMIETLLDEGALDIGSLQLLQYGSSPIHPETLRRTMAALPGVKLLQLFGQTEGSPITALTPEDHRLAAGGHEDLLTTVGRAAPGVELRVDTPDEHGIGEVCARADHLFRLGEDGWLHTGDLGRIDDRGYLRLVGRLGDRIIRGGENVYPLEVEHILRDHHQVEDVAVVGIADRRWGEIVKAFVVPADPADLPDPENLRSFARRQLAGYKVPVAWEFTDALPRNPQGKVLRRLLVAEPGCVTSSAAQAADR